MATSGDVVPLARVEEVATDIVISVSAENTTLLADLCRVEANRCNFAIRDDLVPVIVPFLKESASNIGNEEAVIAALRAIGNLTYEQEKPRKQVHDHDGVETIVALLGCASPSVQRVAAGVVNNLCAGGDEVQKAFVDAGIAEKLKNLVQKNDESMFMSLKAINNLSCEEDLAADWRDTQLIKFLLEMLETDGDDEAVIGEVVTFIANTREDEETWQLLQADGKLLKRCINFIHNVGKSNDPVAMKKVSDLLVDISKDDKYRQPLHDDFDMWMRFARLGGIAQATGIMILAHLSLDDKGCERLIAELENIHLDAESNDVSVQMGQAMLLGNLPRNDESAKKLVMNDSVTKVLLHYIRTLEDDRVRHLAVAGLRNLSLPVEAKEKFKEWDILPRIVEILKTSPNAPVLYECIRCVKSLLTEKSFHADFMNVDKVDGMSALEVIETREFQDGQERVPLEAGRVWVILADNPDNIAQLVEGRRFAGPLIRLLQSKFPLLHGEAARAVHLLYSPTQAELAPVFAADETDASLFSALREVLCSTNDKNVRSLCVRAISSLIGAASLDAVEKLKLGEFSKTEDLLGALNTCVFDDHVAEDVDKLKKLLK